MRRKLELGIGGPHSQADRPKSANSDRDRWETRELMVFPAKARVRGFAVGRPHPNRASPGAHGLQARPQDRTLQAKRTRPSSGFPRLPAKRPSAGTNGSAVTGASRTAATTCATQLSPRTLRAFAEPRHRRPLALFRLQHDQDRGMPKCPQRPLARRPGYRRRSSRCSIWLRTEQP